MHFIDDQVLHRKPQGRVALPVKVAGRPRQRPCSLRPRPRHAQRPVAAVREVLPEENSVAEARKPANLTNAAIVSSTIHTLYGRQAGCSWLQQYSTCDDCCVCLASTREGAALHRPELAELSPSHDRLGVRIQQHRRLYGRSPASRHQHSRGPAVLCMLTQPTRMEIWAQGILLSAAVQQLRGVLVTNGNRWLPAGRWTKHQKMGRMPHRRLVKGHTSL